MDLYVVGAGGFGRETLDAALAAGRGVAGFLDDRLAGQVVRGLPVLATADAPPGAAYVVGIADPVVRRRLVGELEARGLVPETVVHPRAVVGPDTEVGAGSVVLANAHVSSSIRLGRHVQVNYNATVGHDAVLADFVTVYPGANVGGTTRLDDDVTVGSNAAVLQGLHLGRGAFVGAGAVVTRDVAAGVVVTGVPARPAVRGRPPVGSLVLPLAVAFAAAAAAVRLRPAALTRLPRPALAALALAGAAAAAAAAGGAATGLGPLDVVLRALLGAVVVPAAAVSSSVLLVVLAVVGVFVGAGSAGGSLAAAALGLVAACAVAGVPSPVARALAGGLLAQAALRLEWPTFTGGPSLAAAVLVVPLLVVGLTRLPRRPRRWALAAGGVVVVLGGAASALAGLAVLDAKADVDEAVDAARDGLRAVARQDREQAVARLRQAARAFASAEEAAGPAWARPALAVPLVGQHARAVRTLASAGADLAETAAVAVEEADVDRVRLVGGRLDLEAMAAIDPPLARSLAALDRAQARLEGVRSPWLVAPVADRLDEFDDRVTTARGDARRALDAVRAVPALLGADGPRRYFLAVMTPAESRASGGLIGNFGEITADDGRLDLTRFGRSEELNFFGDRNARRLDGPAEYLARYGRFEPAAFWQNVPMSPDFPTVADVIGQLYPQSGGLPVDGVVTVDPAGLAALLRVVGPVEVAGWPEPLTAGNVEQVLLHEQYVRFPEDERVDFLGGAARTVWDRVVSSSLPAPSELAEAVGPAVAGRHVQVASTRPREQAFLARVGLTGALPPVAGDAIAVFTQNSSGNKIDFFLHRSITYEAAYDPEEGHVEARLDVALENRAPAGGLPKAVILGTGLEPTGPGENRTLLSIYSPLALGGATIDGQPLAMEAATELGRNVYSAAVVLPPQGTRTVTLRLTGRLAPSAAYRLTLAPQAMANPDQARVVVRLPAGLRAGSGGGRVAEASFPLDRVREVEVVAERPRRPWDRFLAG